MAIFALIGGKSNQLDKNKIERHLVSLVKDKVPTILFCPYAQLDISKSTDRFHQLMKNVDCKIIDLTLENVSKFEEYLLQSDILYIGGGHCDDLVHFFKEHQLDAIIKKYLSTNKIFAGSSAGAMLYVTSAMGDKDVFIDNSHYYNYKMVDCLGILNITICPHYQVEDLTIYNDALKKYPLDAFGIEEGTMVVIKDSTYYVVKEDSYRSIYYFDSKKEYLMIPLYEGEVYEKDCGFRSDRDI